MREKIYVAIKLDGVREVIRAESDPNEASHGADFIGAIGPFRTVRGANFFRDHGRGNPNCLTVWDAEHWAKRDAERRAFERHLERRARGLL